jgi:hypothetical protein
MFRFTGELLNSWSKCIAAEYKGEACRIIGRLHVSRDKLSVIAGGSGFEEVTVVVTEIDVDGAQAEAGFG